MRTRPVTDTEYADHLNAMKAVQEGGFENTTDANPGDLLIAVLAVLAYLAVNAAWWLIETLISGGWK